MRKSFYLVAAALIAGLFTAPAAEAAPAPITLACGMSITVPGSYRATNSVLDCGNAVVVDIEADNVVLDLADHAVGGDVINCVRAIEVTAGVTNVIIRNGTVRDCDSGVSAESTTDVTVTNILATNNGTGILLDTASRATGNTATRNSTAGIEVLDNNVVSNNRVLGNDGPGILVDDENKVKGNQSSGNDVGIDVSNENNISRNDVIGNAVGIEGGNFNVVVENTVRGSGAAGISLVHGNTVHDNVVNANEDDGIDIGSQNSVKRNTTKGNGGHGIAVSEENRIIANRAHDNVRDGIFVAVPSVSTTIKDNIANFNGEQGIDAGAGVLGARTNRAKGNAIDPQCDPTNLCV